MFGYVTVYKKGLSPAAQERYQAYYCGLCRALGRRFGVPGQMTLSFELTFAAVLLSALYEPETSFHSGRCLPHPAAAKPRADNEFLDYAADLSVLLAYENFLDDWQDDRSARARSAARRLEKHLPGIRARRPRQCEAVRAQLDALQALECAGSHDLDALCGAFGALLGAVLDPKGDLWGPVLQGVGRGLGGFIYLMDAYDDLEKDRRRGRFNALADLAAALSPAEYEARCHELLTQQIALCAQSFEFLPILKDSAEGQILYNAVYSGVWCKYTLIRQKRTHREGRGT